MKLQLTLILKSKCLLKMENSLVDEMHTVRLDKFSCIDCYKIYEKYFEEFGVVNMFVNHHFKRIDFISSRISYPCLAKVSSSIGRYCLIVFFSLAHFFKYKIK